MELRAAMATHVGQVRTLNEDSVMANAVVCAVADGMGGHRGGEVASAMALDELSRNYAEPTADSLVAAVAAANRAVHAHAGAHPELAGMGTTLCAAAVTGPGQICIVNIGDSRAYLWDGQNLHQLTEDHSLVEALVREGRLSAEQAAVHPHRNVVTRALGIDDEVAVDAWELTVVTGQRLLLCSDGLFNEVDDDSIAAVLAGQSDPQIAADQLISLANDAGARDNVSVVVVDPVGAPTGPTDVIALRRLTEPVSDLGSPDDETLDERAAAALAGPPGAVVVPPQPGGGAVATATAVAGAVASGAVVGAGIPGDVPAVSAGGGPNGDRVDSAQGPRSVTWRVVAFVGAVTAVMAIAFGAVVLAARSTYFVRASGDEVVVYQGRPGGLLWFEPTVVERTGIQTSELPSEQRIAELSRSSGVEQASRAAADAYVNQLRADVAAGPTTTTSVAPDPLPPTTVVPTTAAATVPPTTAAGGA